MFVEKMAEAINESSVGGNVPEPSAHGGPSN